MASMRMHATKFRGALPQKVHLAHHYPYARPDASFVFLGDSTGGAWTFDTNSWPGVRKELLNLSVHSWHEDINDSLQLRLTDAVRWQAGLKLPKIQKALDSGPWTMVLAVGSNGSSAQLARKFRHPDERLFIPVVQGVLHNYDVVYAPYMARYGAVPATLIPAPGTRVLVSCLFLQPPHLAKLDATELGPYQRVTLKNVFLRVGTREFDDDTCDSGVLHTAVDVYVHTQGALELPLHHTSSGSPIALESVPARNRLFPALSQQDLLQLVRLRHSAATQQSQDPPTVCDRGSSHPNPTALSQYTAPTEPSTSCGPSASMQLQTFRGRRHVSRTDVDRPGSRHAGQSSGSSVQGAALEQWTLDLLDDPEERGDLQQWLAGHARPVEFPSAALRQPVLLLDQTVKVKKRRSNVSARVWPPILPWW